MYWFWAYGLLDYIFVIIAQFNEKKRKIIDNIIYAYNIIGKYNSASFSTIIRLLLTISVFGISGKARLVDHVLANTTYMVSTMWNCCLFSNLCARWLGLYGCICLAMLWWTHLRMNLFGLMLCWRDRLFMPSYSNYLIFHYRSSIVTIFVSVDGVDIQMGLLNFHSIEAHFLRFL